MAQLIRHTAVSQHKTYKDNDIYLYMNQMHTKTLPTQDTNRKDPKIWSSSQKNTL